MTAQEREKKEAEGGGCDMRRIKRNTRIQCACHTPAKDSNRYGPNEHCKQGMPAQRLIGAVVFQPLA